MSWRVEALPEFVRMLKRLHKKYPSIRADVQQFMVALAQNPVQGTALGNDCYKIRLAIKSKNQGKSGGARVITLVARVAQQLTLLTIYDKSEQETISDERLADLARQAVN